MQGQCDTYPIRFVRSRGKVQFRYNIAAIEEDGKTSYTYDYVEADAPTRESILAAMSGIDDAETILDAAGEIIVREEPSIT